MKTNKSGYIYNQSKVEIDICGKLLVVKSNTVCSRPKCLPKPCFCYCCHPCCLMLILLKCFCC
ncbi:MAG: hypothetical protein FWC80_00055 [Firmicutes bacterium]|nr:hypothetical protein [Bacillota bacterium]